jgi:hypothetical protein
VGGSVLLNGLLLHIYDCDAFTRGHMPDQPAPTPVPTGEYLTPRFEGVSSNPRNSGTPLSFTLIPFHCHVISHYSPHHGPWFDGGMYPAVMWYPGPRVMPPHNLDHVRPRLLFYARWDDGRELGLVHFYRLTYHTCDDTIEIKQVHALPHLTTLCRPPSNLLMCCRWLSWGTRPTCL